MKIRIPKKHVAVGLAALMLASSYQLKAVIAETVTASDAELMTAAATEQAETGTTESEADSERLSSVTVVHTAEITEESYEPTDWWKADLEEYSDSFSLVKYETVASSGAEGDLAEDETVSEDGEEATTEERENEKKEATLVAEGNVNDTVISDAPTQSAVSSVSDGQFAFTTYGYGHGVGMSQNGANFYAKYAGWDYQDILFHYYPGTTLMNTGTAETEKVTVKGVSGDVLMQVAEIVNREVGPSMHVETIKAQAVAVYTYIKYYNNDAHDLKGKKNPPQSLIDACASVLGEALYYNGDYALTMFYASSGGITANCSDVFTQDIPYLRSVASEYDAAYDPHYGDVIYYSVEQLRRKLQNAYGITLSSNPENWITIVEGNGGYVNKVIIDGQVTVRGNSFRSVMGFKSPKFTYICSVNQQEPETTAPTEAPTTPAPATEAPATNAPETTAPVTEVVDPTEASVAEAEVVTETEAE